VEPLPQPEPTEEVVYTNEPPTGGMKTTSADGPQPRSLTPLSYVGEEPVVRPGEKVPHTSQPTGQGQPQPPSDLTTVERPQKVPRRSGNFTFIIDGETQPTTVAARPVHWLPTEEDGLPDVKIEEGGSVPKLKEEVVEFKIDSELEQISRLLRMKTSARIR